MVIGYALEELGGLIELERFYMMCHIVEVNCNSVNFVITYGPDSDLNKLIDVRLGLAGRLGQIRWLCFYLKAVNAVLLRWLVDLSHYDLFKAVGAVHSIHHPLQLLRLIFASRTHRIEVIFLEQLLFVDLLLALKTAFLLFSDLVSLKVLQCTNQKLLRGPIAKH